MMNPYMGMMQHPLQQPPVQQPQQMPWQQSQPGGASPMQNWLQRMNPPPSGAAPGAGGVMPQLGQQLGQAFNSNPNLRNLFGGGAPGGQRLMPWQQQPGGAAPPMGQVQQPMRPMPWHQQQPNAWPGNGSQQPQPQYHTQGPTSLGWGPAGQKPYSGTAPSY